MKSKITIFSLLLIVVLLLWDVSNNFTYSDGSGAPGGVSGSPGDNYNTCSKSGCHTGFVVTAIPGIITSNIPVTGYMPGHTYTITATCTQAGISKWGFEISPQSPNGTLLGIPVITNSITTKITSFKYVTHRTAGNSGANSKTWSFNWIAPIMGTGDVTFYGAFNYANNNGSASGDHIHTSTLIVSEATATSVNNVIEQETSFNVYPNPVTTASQVSLYMKEPGSVHLSFLNTIGQVVREICNEKNVNGSFIYNFNKNDFPSPGIYFVRFDTEKGTVAKRVVVY